MMLRSRNVNNSNINNPSNKELANQKRGAKKHLEDHATSALEPKAKRQALSDLSQGIKNFAIDSAKKVIDLKKNNKRSDSDSLPAINENVEEIDPCPQFDFDKEVANDVYAISEFAADVFKYYRSREKNFVVQDYMGRQTKINKLNRASLIDWMVEIQENFELNHETLYLAIKFLDIYLSKEDASCDNLQIVACSVLLIASKFDERSPPLLDDFVYMAEDTFNRDQLIKVEIKMLGIIGYDLGVPLSYSYLRRYSRVIHGDMETLTLARYILETIQLFYDFVTASDSKLAAATFLLALKMKDSTAVWSDVLYKYSGYQEAELMPLLNSINHAMHTRMTGPYAKLGTVFAKYSHEVFFKSAAVPLIPDALTNTPAPQ